MPPPGDGGEPGGMPSPGAAAGRDGGGSAQGPETRRERLASVARVFAPLGWRAIGGPAVHVTLMERSVVARDHWLGRDELRRLFAACNLLPGPGSTQLALLLGLRR